MEVGRNGVVGAVFVIGLAAGLTWADPTSDAYNEATRLLEAGRAEAATPYFDRAALSTATTQAERFLTLRGFHGRFGRLNGLLGKVLLLKAAQPLGLPDHPVV